jgi:hypothetical protein
VLVGRVRTATALAAAHAWFEPKSQILIRTTFVMGETSLSLDLRRWGGMMVWPQQMEGFRAGRRDSGSRRALREGYRSLAASREPKHAVRKKKISQLSGPAMRSPFFTLLLARPEGHRSRALVPDGSQRRQPVTGNMGRIGSKIGKKAVSQAGGR